MNKKINLADIVDSLAEKTGRDRSLCDAFVRNFLVSIADSLEIDGLAKLKGFGTFKLIQVEERKSVNVQTGEEVIIPSHKKITFTLDKTFKEEVNAPFSHLQTYIVKPDAPLDPEEPEEDDSDLNEAVTEVVTNGEKSVSEQQPNVNHDEWFDNWEVEYDDQTEDQQVGSLTDTTSAVSDVFKSDSMPVTDEKDSKEYILKNECVTEEPVNAGDNVAENISGPLATEPEINEAPEKEEVNIQVTFNENVDATDSDLLESNSQSANELNNEVPAEDDSQNDLQDASPVDDNDQLTEAKEYEPVGGDTEKTELEADSSIGSSAETGENADVDTQEPPVSSVSAKPEAVKVILEDFPSIEPAVSSVSAKPEAVANPEKKKLGVGVFISVVVLVGLILCGLIFSPEFFSFFKMGESEIYTVPIDSSTSIVQELSAYDNDTTTAQETVTEESEQAEVAEPSSEQGEIYAEVSNNFDASFVHYMKVNHPNVKLNVYGEPTDVTIVKGLYLTQVSEQNYGDKKFWIYLYLYNTDRIKNPNNVLANTVVRVPKLDKTLVDSNSQESLDLATEIRNEFVK